MLLSQPLHTDAIQKKETTDLKFMAILRILPVSETEWKIVGH